MHKMKITGAMIALLLVIIIVFQNMEDVDTKILFIDVTMPNAVLLGITFLIGTSVGLLTAFICSGKSKAVKENKKETHQ